METIILRDYQHEAVNKFTQSERFRIILNHPVRSGKTITALFCCRWLLENIPNVQVLIITLPNIREAWKKEALRCGVKAEVRSWTELGKFTLPPNCCLVVDEIHNFKSLKSQRYKRLQELCDQSPLARIFLTGTLFKENRNINVYPIIQLMGHPISEKKFISLFTNPSDKLGNNDTPGLLKLIEPYTHSLKIYEHKIVRHELKCYYPKIQDGTHFTEYLRMESLAKIPATIQKTLENLDSDRKLVIFSWFIDSADAIASALELRGIRCLKATGDISPKSRSLLVQSFWDCPDTIVYVGTIAANKEGVNLSCSPRLIMHDLCWEHTNNYQALARCDMPENGIIAHKEYMSGGWIGDLLWGCYLKKENLTPQKFQAAL